MASAFKWIVDKLDPDQKVIHLKPAPKVQVVVAVTYYDPLADAVKPLPAGVELQVMDGDTMLDKGVTDAQGVVTIPERTYPKTRLSLQVDFKDNVFIDVGAQKMVPRGVLPGDARKLIRMPDIWRSKEQKTFADDRGSKFEDGTISDFEAGGLGTPAAPWKVQLDHAWKRLWVAFKRYDGDAKKDAGLPTGMLVQAYDKELFTDDKLIGAGSILNDDGLVSLGLFRAFDPGDVYLNSSARFLRLAP